MNLQAMAASLLAGGFDPKTSPLNDNQDLPAGEYDVVLEKVEWKVNDKGTEWLSLVFEVLTEGFENRKHFGNIFYTEKMMERALKQTMKCAAALDVELLPEDFADPETNLVEAFEDALGAEVGLKITHSKPKAGGNPFVNFELLMEGE